MLPRDPSSRVGLSYFGTFWQWTVSAVGMVLKKKLVFLLLGTLLLAGGLLGSLLRWQVEEYSVYQAVIGEAFSGDEVSYYLILDTTEPVNHVGISDFHSKGLGLRLDSKLSYTLRNIFRFHLSRKLQLPHPYRLVSEADLASLHSLGQETSSPSRELNELFKKSWGVITLSRVGFDYKMQHAVVYAQLTYCGLCGEGMYLYLSKEKGVWHIVSRSGTWIS